MRPRLITMIIWIFVLLFLLVIVEYLRLPYSPYTKEIKMERLCDEDCNYCPIISHKNSRQLTLILNQLLQQLGEKVYKIVQDGCPNMTVCYDCRIDDFTHTEDCRIIGHIDRSDSIDITQLKHLPHNKVE